MTFYELLLLVHILGVLAWVGAGLGLVILGARADRADDEPSLTRLFQEAGVLGKTLFLPASLVVLATGIAMTIDTWAFDTLWIALALVGIAMTIVTGAGVLGPRSERVGQAIADNRGVVTAEHVHEMRAVLLLARLDYGVLFAIVVLMVLKPSGDDVGVLVALALVVAGWFAYVLSKVKALEAGAPPAAATP